MKTVETAIASPPRRFVTVNKFADALRHEKHNATGWMCGRIQLERHATLGVNAGLIGIYGQWQKYLSRKSRFAMEIARSKGTPRCELLGPAPGRYARARHMFRRTV